MNDTNKKWMSGVLAVAMAATMSTVGLPRVYGSDHREAPTVDAIPEGDLTDVYAFVDPNNSANVILIMNVNPFAQAAEGGSYAFSPDLLYQFKIDNTGDAREDLVVQIVFDKAGQGQTASIYGPAVPTITGARNVLLSSQPTATGTFSANGTVTTFGTASTVLGYVGLRDDPFVFDFAQFTRILNGSQDLFRNVGAFRGRPVRTDGTSGVDTFAGFNVTSIAVSIPKTALAGTLKGSSGGAQINVWATVSQRVPTRRGAKTYQQFERQGQQAFATIFIPSGAPRDAENFEIPEHDVANYSSIIPDALTTTDTDGTGNTFSGRAATLTALGLTALPNGAPLLLPANTAQTNKDLLRVALLPDVLRLDMGLAAGTNATGQFGLQNGRTLNYSSIDAPLQLIRQLADVHFPTGSGIPGSGPVGSRVALDCTAYPACGDRRVLVVLQGTQFIKPDASLIDLTTVGNDRAFLTAFPYLAAPAPLPGDAGTIGYPAQQ